MPRCQSAYPPHAASARTFHELFRAFSVSWPLAFRVAAARGWGLDEYAGHLLGMAQKVAARFPTLELWDHLPKVLEAALKRFDPGRPWSFDRLFDRTLAQRLGREEARAGRKAHRTARKAREAADGLHRRRTPDPQEAIFQRWGRRLAPRAAAYLDGETGVYVTMRLAPVSDSPVQNIAKALGVTKAHLRNRYAGQKVGALVQPALAVRAMPYDHVQRLVRHLREEAGLPDAWVAGLLGGVVVKVDPSVSLMEEGPLVAFLGWGAEENLGGGSDFRHPPGGVRSRGSKRG
jgi:hypothetical protein